jgi:2-amino-4-deoxychorismate synthase
LESACRAIARYEPAGRGYYSGVMALIGRDSSGRTTLDSAILIRTAEIERNGGLTIGAGATVVRHSDPLSEAAETRAKAAALTHALDSEPHLATRPSPRNLAADPRIEAALSARNNRLARFWLHGAEPGDRTIAGERHVLVIDAEDAFTAMLAHQIRSIGPAVVVRRYDDPFDVDGYDLVVIGPGPGDPTRREHPKIQSLRTTLRGLLAGRMPTLAVCLGHQVLSAMLGFELRRRAQPNQGVQREIELFGERARVGFYNTFAAVSDEDQVRLPAGGAMLDVSRDKATGEIHALRGPGLRSFQFHPESVLSPDGLSVLSNAVHELLSETAAIRGGDDRR